MHVGLFVVSLGGNSPVCIEVYEEDAGAVLGGQAVTLTKDQASCDV